MTSHNARPAQKAGKPVFVQRGGKGKWGAQSPPTATQPGFSSSSNIGASTTHSAVTTSGSSSNSVAGKETIVSEADAKHMHDRMLFLLSHMIGMTVEVTVKNGSKYEGLLHTAFTEGDLGIVLRLAKALSGKDKKDGAPLVSQLIILAKDCVAISVTGVDFVPHERAGPERGEREGFKTDTDISRSGDIRERDLKKWAPEEHTAFGGIEDDLGDTQHNSRAGWDQFAANERLFGVKTDFDEELYTTKLDRTGSDFKAREQQAIQIANEIQQSVSTNVHMREERGLAVDDSGLDEEDLYGAVVRDPLPIPNKYMPPAMRRQQELNQHKRPATPSQQPSRQSPSSAQRAVSNFATAATAAASTPQQQQQQRQPFTQEAELKHPTEHAAATTTTSAEAAPVPGKPSEGASVSRSNSTKGGSAQFNLNDLRTHNPVSTLLNAATIQGSKNQQIPEHAVDSKQIEDNLAKFAMTARTFATNDKALINQTKMGLTQRRTELFQKEKDGLAAELKQFGKDLDKKLITPVPDDVKEIFGKKNDSSMIGDKPKEPAGSKVPEKENEQGSDKMNIAAETKDARPSASKPLTTSATPSTTEKPAAEKVGLGSSFKLNIKASVFKPNVNAAPFTPSFATGDKKAPAAMSPSVDKNLFFGKTVKKGVLPLQQSMASPFRKGQPTPSPATVTPTWPYGQRSFRHLFQVTSGYEDDMMYNQGLGQHGGNSASGYYAMAPYNYGPAGQYGPPPMTMAGPSHMVPFMGAAGPVPFSQPPPPPPGMPHAGAGSTFPQMAPTSAPHYVPQGFPPGRSNMIPPAGMHIPMYPYPPSPHVGGPVMMRYPPPDMMPPMGPGGMMMHQRPMGMDPQMMHYPGRREAGGSEADNSPETASNN